MSHRFLAACAATVLVVSACGGEDDNGADPTPSVDTAVSAGTTAPPPDTEPPPVTEAPPVTEPADDPAPSEPEAVDDVAPFAEAGPYPVGTVTLQLEKGPLVEVWYPAAEATTGNVSYDVRDFTPEGVRALLTDDVPVTFSFPGERDVEVASDGPFPVVLFSHGASGFRLQSSFLTSHLASYGMIVVAPDHPSRLLTNVLVGAASGDRDDAVDDLLAALDLVLAENDTAGSRFEGRVDPERVAALGHSAGGGTILGAALDERVDGYVSMAAGGPAEPNDFPSVPSFFLAGADDGVVAAAARTRPAFEAAPTPAWYWELDATGHNAFSDFCTFGGGTGIIGVAEASGLGEFLNAQPQLRALGEDGCVPPAVPVEQVFPVIRHGVTAWLRWLFDADTEPIGLGDEITTAADVDIVVVSR
jgi:dienelactone hydrolase